MNSDSNNSNQHFSYTVNADLRGMPCRQSKKLLAREVHIAREKLHRYVGMDKRNTKNKRKGISSQTRLSTKNHNFMKKRMILPFIAIS